MTRDELEKTVHLCTRDFKEFHLIMDAVDAYISASNYGKPIVSGSLPPTMEEIYKNAKEYERSFNVGEGSAGAFHGFIKGAKFVKDNSGNNR